MRILIVNDKYPMYDCSAGDLRLLTILKILSQNNEVHYHSYRTHKQVESIGSTDTETYRQAVVNLGVAVEEDDIESILKHHKFDFIFFEFYMSARRNLHKARYWQPNARIIIDTVDVHFKRLLSQASITGEKSVLAKARQMKKRELSAYKEADILLAVTDADKEELLKHNNKWLVKIIPTIHEKQPLCKSMHRSNSLIFIGGFKHVPNVDAVIYFCNEVLPLLKNKFSDIRLTIVGSSPPHEIMALSSENIEVTGFVPDTKPYLLSNSISIAPLRFGAGMKGKIGEAMSHGLPVVTTTVGIEGFGLTPGENVLVGDSPESFAESVARLLEDSGCYEKIRRNGWSFIKDRYSHDVVSALIYELFESVKDCPVKKISMLQQLRTKVSSLGRNKR